MSSNFEELLKIQRLAADSLMRENEVDSKINFLNLIRQISSTKKIQVEQIILTAQEEGMRESQVLDLIDELIKDDYIYQPEPGYVQVRN